MAEQFRAARFADADPDVRGAAKAWLNNPTRRNLLLVGAVGTGKTWTAHAVVRDLVERSGDNWPLIVTAPNLFRALRPGGPEDFYDEVCEVPLLLLDDLGAEKPSEWTGEQLTSIIDTRWANHRPIIATSNLNLPALSEAIGERAYSRLAKAGTTIVGFDGPDRRKEVASDD
jgi:DNA replication protein DnaC